jgi:predicted ATPase
MPQNNHRSDNKTDRRVIMTGASGVGKTTLVEMLAPLLSLPIIPELARQMCADLGYERIGDVPDQEGFKWRVLEEQNQSEDKLNSFISDRSAIDCWVLWQRWNICAAMSYDTERYYTSAREQAQRYSHIIFVPAMFPPPEDGFRWTDPDYQKQIERNVRMTLYDWDLWNRTYVVESTTPEQRAHEVSQWLETHPGSSTSE